MAKNTDLVPQKDLETIAKLDSQVIILTESMSKLLVQLTAVSKELSTSMGGYKELTEIIARLDKLEKQLVETDKKHTQTLTEKEKAERKLNATYGPQAKEVALLRVQSQQRTRQLNTEARETLAAAGSIDQLSARLTRLIRIQNSMSPAQAQKWGASFTKEIQRIDTLVKQSDFAQGRFQRNVGNYAGGFSQLGFQVQQIARELPSLTMSASQFFLAISNNLPMLADQLQRSKAEYAALKAEGKQGVPVWKQLIKSVLSWQTALVVGITVITAYGKEIGEFFKSLVEGRNAALTATQAIKDINKAMEFDNVGTKIAEFEKLRKSWVALGDDAKDRKQFLVDYRTELDNTGIAVNNVNDADNLFIKNSQTYIQSLMLRAKAQAGVTLAAKAYAKAVENDADKELQRDNAEKRITQNKAKLAKLQKDYSELPISGYKNQIIAMRAVIKDDEELIAKIKEDTRAAMERGDAYIKAAQNISKAEMALLEDAGLDKKGDKSLNSIIETLKKLRDAEINAGQEINAFWLENQAELYKIIAESEKEGYTKRLSSLTMFLSTQKQLVEDARANQVENLIADTMKETGLSREEAEKKVANQIMVINAKAWHEVLKIDQDGTKIREDIDKDYTEAVIRNIAKRAEAQAGASAGSESAELTVLAQEYAKGEMKAEEYEAKKTEIARRYAGERFDAEAVMLMEQLETLGLTAEQREEIEKKLAEAGVKYQQWANSIIISDAEKAAQKEQQIAEQLAQKKQEILQGAFNLATTLMAAQTEKELHELEKRKEQADEADEEEKDRIERLEEAGAISKEEADARKAAVDAAAKVREEEMARKRIEIQRKQAIFEKTIAISQIAINTAVAIMKNTAQLGLAFAAPLNILTLALGVVQAATVAAQPIPQYAEGTENHPGGLAVVGDGGKSEAVIYGGKVWKTPAKPTIVDLPKGVQVMPDFKQIFLDNYTGPKLSGISDEKGTAPVIDMSPVKKGFKDSNTLLTNIRKEFKHNRLISHYDQITNTKKTLIS